jgi:hypothetical protein
LVVPAKVVPLSPEVGIGVEGNRCGGGIPFGGLLPYLFPFTGEDAVLTPSPYQRASFGQETRGH